MYRYISIKARVFIYMSRWRLPILWDSCDIGGDHLVPLRRGGRNVDKLGLDFDFRVTGDAPNHAITVRCKYIRSYTFTMPGRPTLAYNNRMHSSPLTSSKSRRQLPLSLVPASIFMSTTKTRSNRRNVHPLKRYISSSRKWELIVLSCPFL